MNTRIEGYELLSLLGKGGMGAVYKARQISLDRLVALKIMIPDRSVTPQLVDRFRRETQILMRLSHPNLVEVLDADVNDDQPYVALELIDGMDLAQYFARFSPVAIPAGLALLAGLCEAIGYLHSQKVNHRDLKPSNILVSYDGGLKVVDFGLAKGDRDAALTRSSQLIGTTAYLAPEVVEGASIGPSSDVYAVGLIGYELLVGELPYYGDNFRDWLRKIRFTVPRPPAEVRAEVPRVVSDLVMALLEKDPSRRPLPDEVARVCAQVRDSFVSGLTTPVTQGHDSPVRSPRVMSRDEWTAQLPVLSSTAHGSNSTGSWGVTTHHGEEGPNTGDATGASLATDSLERDSGQQVSDSGSAESIGGVDPRLLGAAIFLALFMFVAILALAPKTQPSPPVDLSAISPDPVVQSAGPPTLHGEWAGGLEDDLCRRTRRVQFPVKLFVASGTTLTDRTLSLVASEGFSALEPGEIGGLFLIADRTLIRTIELTLIPSKAAAAPVAVRFGGGHLAFRVGQRDELVAQIPPIACRSGVNLLRIQGDSVNRPRILLALTLHERACQPRGEALDDLPPDLEATMETYREALWSARVGDAIGAAVKMREAAPGSLMARSVFGEILGLLSKERMKLSISMGSDNTTFLTGFFDGDGIGIGTPAHILLSRAIVELGAVLERRPLHARSWSALGIALGLAGDVDWGLWSQFHAVLLDPSDHEILQAPTRFTEISSTRLFLTRRADLIDSLEAMQIRAIDLLEKRAMSEKDRARELNFAGLAREMIQGLRVSGGK